MSTTDLRKQLGRRVDALADWHWQKITKPTSRWSHLIAFVFAALLLLIFAAALGLTQPRPIFGDRHVSYLNAVNWALASFTVIPAFIYMFLEALRVTEQQLLAADTSDVWIDQRRRLGRWWCAFVGVELVVFLAGWADNSALPLLGWVDEPSAIDWSVGHLDRGPGWRFANGAFALAAYLVMAAFGVFVCSFLAFTTSLAATLDRGPRGSGAAQLDAAREVATRVFFAAISFLVVCYLVRIWHQFVHDEARPPSDSLLPFLFEGRDYLDYLDMRLINIPSVFAALAAFAVGTSALHLALRIEKFVGVWPSRVKKWAVIAIAAVGVLSVLFYWFGALASAVTLVVLLVRGVIRITRRDPAWWFVSALAALAAMALVVLGTYVGWLGRVVLLVGVGVFLFVYVFRWERRFFRLGAATLGTLTAWHTLPRVSFGFDVRTHIGKAWGSFASEPPSALVTVVLLAITALLLALDFKTHQTAGATTAAAAPASASPRDWRAALRAVRTDAILAALTLGIPVLGLLVPAIRLRPSVATLVYTLYFLTRLFLWSDPADALTPGMRRARRWVERTGVTILRWLVWVVASFMLLIWLASVIPFPWSQPPRAMREVFGVRVPQPVIGLHCVKRDASGCLQYGCTVPHLIDEPLELEEGTGRDLPINLPLPSNFDGVQVEVKGRVEVRGGDESSSERDVEVRLRTDHGPCKKAAEAACVASSTGKGRRPINLEGLARANRQGPIVFRLEVQRCRRGGEEGTCSFDEVHVCVTPW